MVLALTISLAAQETGIQFEKMDWESTLKMAKEQDKIIFVDAFTTWCGPCKWMDKNVFPDKAVGEYFNKNFINVKIDMEKGEGILFAKAYKVRGFPSFVFIDAKGNMLHKSLGSREAKDFIGLGEAASDPDRQVITLQNRYNEGEESPEFLKRYAEALSGAGFEEAGKVAEEYLATQKDWNTEANLNFIYEQAPWRGESKLSDYLKANRTAFYKYIEQEKVDGKIKFLLQSSFRSKPGITEAQIAKAYTEVFGDKGQYMTDEYLVQKHMYSRKKEDHTKFFELATAFFNKYDVEDSNLLNEMAWRVYELTDDVEVLKQARAWAIKSVQLKSGYANNDTLAAVCYKLKEKDAAMKHCNIAIELAKADGSDYAETEKLKEKIAALD